jgi:hypothetical protein
MASPLRLAVLEAIIELWAPATRSLASSDVQQHLHDEGIEVVGYELNAILWELERNNFIRSHQRTAPAEDSPLHITWLDPRLWR